MAGRRSMGRGAAALGLLAILAWPPLPAAAQAPPPPGSTVNGRVPLAEGNRWNGLDHQPTPAEIAPIRNPSRRARVSRTLGRLDRKLLAAPLPKLPPGAPTVGAN